MVNLHLALSSGGYKYPFYTGVMRYIESHSDVFKIKSISGCSVGNCSTLVHASGYNKEHYISARTWLAESDTLLKFDPKNLMDKSLFTLDESFFEYYINYSAIMSRDYDIYFSYMNSKTKEIEYIDVKSLPSRDAILYYLKGSCTIPILMKKEIGDENDGYIIDAGLSAPFPTEKLDLAPEKDLKIVVLSINPFGKKKGFNLFTFPYDYLSDKLSEYILEDYRDIACDIDFARDFMEKNRDKNYIYIYPESNEHYYNTFEYKREDPMIRQLDGFSRAKQILNKYVL